MMKGYMLKYALTQGIIEVEIRGSSRPSTTSGQRTYVYTTGKYTIQLINGKDFFESREDAVEAAKAMAVKKKINLNKQLVKVEKLCHEPKWGTLE